MDKDYMAELEELESLAQDFIMDYAPLTGEQREIIRKLRLVEDGLKHLRLRIKRLEQVHTGLYLQLAESKPDRI